MHKLIILLSLAACSNTLQKVNAQINANPYIDNVYNCRNYTIDKYKKLKELGYKDKEMQFVITSFHKEPHVVLNVDGWILDNTHTNIYPASRNLRSGMSPEYWLKVNELIASNYE